MNKKSIAILLVGIIAYFLFASYNQSNGVSPDDNPEVYVLGQEDMLLQLEDVTQYDHRNYIDVDALEDVIRSYFDGPTGDELVDALIYHPDIKLYEASDILEGLFDYVTLYE